MIAIAFDFRKKQILVFETCLLFFKYVTVASVDSNVRFVACVCLYCAYSLLSLW